MRADPGDLAILDRNRTAGQNGKTAGRIRTIELHLGMRDPNKLADIHEHQVGFH
jgi:hypothetical protein